jgi:predicted RNase H-like HicB family nuclease
MVNKYEYIINWSEEDQVYIASVVEFPSLQSHGDSDEIALKEIKSVVSFVIADMKKHNEKIPEPLSTRKYSGKFNIRIPKHLHRKLVSDAVIQNISLNQMITYKLSIG